MSGVDPHFARLLNGLSLSATGVPLVKGTTPVGPKSPKPPTSGAHPPALPIDVGKISHPIHSSSTVAASPHNLPRSPSIKPNGTLPHASRSPSPLTPSSLTDSKQSTSTISTQVPVSPRVPTTRRSSGISADISPYLSRATAAPVIPKQIKYLAMLENVAKESERATPNLERQLVSTHGAINHISHERPPPSSSVPPHMMGRPLEPPVLYSSGPGVPPSSLGLNPYLHQPTLPAQPVYDPFTVRPRTSNAFHPIPYPPHFPRASMNEEQFRLMISGPGPRPAPPNYAGLQRPGPPLLPSFTSRSFAPHSVSSHTNNSQPPLHIVPPQFMSVYQHPEPGPLSAPATSPTFNLFSRANPSNNAQLLSILNTPNIPRAAPSMPRTLG